MDSSILASIRELVTARKVLCLAAIIDGEPTASLLPYAPAPDYASVYVQASTLAKHSRALQAGANVGLLIHDLDTDDVDPLQVARLTVQAVVEPFERGTDDYEAASRVFVARLPSAEMTLDLADFTLYRLRLGRGRFVAGFAQAYNIGPDTFQDLARLG